MRRALVGLAVALFASGCWDFQKLLDDCADGGGVCARGGGTGGGSGGGGAVGGGGGTTDAGSDAGDVDAGDADGGRTVDGGPLCPLLDVTGAGLGATLTQPDGGTSFCFNGFQWENPLPHGDTLWTVSGAAPDDVWAAGTANMLMHWDGQRWNSFQGVVSPTSIDAFLTGVLMLPDGGGWLAGLHAPPHVRVDGDWQPASSPGTGSYDGLAVSPDGRLVALADLDGNVWLNGLQAVASSNGYTSIGGLAVANDGGCVFTASNGSEVSLTRCGDLAIVLDGGATAGPVWIGPDGRFRFSYSTYTTSYTWSVHTLEDDGGWSAPATAAGRIFGVGALPDGGGLLAGEDWHLSTRDAPGTAFPIEGRNSLPSRILFGVAPFADGGAWVVGEGGALVHQEGNQWVPRLGGSLEALEGLLVEPDRVVAVGSSATTLTLGDAPGQLPGSIGDLYDVTPTDAGLLYAGRGGLFTAGGQPVFPFPSGQAALDFYAPPSGDRWAVGEHVIARETMSGWSQVDGGSDVSWWKVDGQGALVIAVGVNSSNGGVVFRSLGEQVLTVGQSLYGVWVESGADGGAAWLVGRNLSLWRLTGEVAKQQTFQSLHSVYGDLYDVWGFDANDVWAVGSDGMVLHYRGGMWIQLEAGTRNHLTRVRGRVLPNGQRELFIVGDFGTVLRYRYTP